MAWAAPWLEDWHELARDCASSDWRTALNAKAHALGLVNARGLPLHFVAQHELPEGAAYEAFIDKTGRVPTRANLHDFFNALVWLSYPKIKRTLNAIQARELAANGIQQTRGSTRDAATLFDENAVLFACADSELAEVLRTHEWEALFVARRSAFGTQYGVFPFGHALLEKLTAPFKAITAHAWIVEVEADFFVLPREQQRAHLDQLVSQQVRTGLPGRGFTPLPVLGVPGWSAGQVAEYYRDRDVFRPKRVKANLEH
ncbi:MAG: DUF3025 domain-containing protein [Burkholderiaceae bacterium]|nr:DUF3025 domain-containing protein [Burkholderiaceae bacterium]